MPETNIAQEEAAVETMGRRLAALRTLKGWTQDTAAEKAGMSQSNLSKIECDASDPPTGVVGRLAALYGVSIDYLVHGKGVERVSA